MESMRHEIEFRQSNRSADFIQGIEEEESDDRFIHRGRMLHTLFSAIETAEDIDPAIERLIFEGVDRQQRKGRRNTGSSPKSILLPGDSRLVFGGMDPVQRMCHHLQRKRGVANPTSRPCNDERRSSKL